MNRNAKVAAVAACAACFIGSGLGSSAVHAAAFGPGSLVVVQFGDGSAALSNTATAGFLNEYNPNFNNNPTGGPLQQLALPTVASGSNKPLTFSGTATSEGFITLSSNGQYLTVTGYNAAPGTAGVTAAAAAGSRDIGRIDLNGNIDTTTTFGDTTNLGNARSVVSDDGNNFWATTSAGGMRYTTLGSAAVTTQISTAPVNTRVANIFGNQLYVTSASAPFDGVATVGTGKPTTSGQTTTELAGFPTVNGPSNYDYFFANANTLYVADDRSVGTLNTGGIEKWTFNGTSWSIAYTLTSGLTNGLRGLAATTDGSGNAVLYGTTGDASPNKLVTITDSIAATTLPGAETFTVLQIAPANTAFRGVELLPGTAPIPEPASAAMMLLGVGTLLMRRSRPDQSA